MMDDGSNGGRLSEVSRLAGVLADQVLREAEGGETSIAKLTALGKAALLLQDCDRPIPDRVVHVLGRALRGEAEDGAGAAHGPADGKADRGSEAARADGREAPWRLLPRLIQSLRSPRDRGEAR